MQGTLFDIQKFSVQDGPGLRTTVFFKGCSLRCRWCHNPESWLPAPQLLYFQDKCTGCGVCRQVCSSETCTLCGACAETCIAGARSLRGREYTVEEVMTLIRKDIPFYEKSGGGVTCSGGECMLQPAFLKGLLQACRKEGISTAVDTAGCVPYKHFEQILPDTDLFLYDIKCISPELHKEFTGADNGVILENYRRLLAAGAPVWVRIPVIPGFNHTPEEMEKLRAFLSQYRPQKVELLPYHALGVSKHRAAGHGTAWESRVPTQAEMDALRAFFKEEGL